MREGEACSRRREEADDEAYPRVRLLTSLRPTTARQASAATGHSEAVKPVEIRFPSTLTSLKRDVNESRPGSQRQSFSVVAFTYQPLT